MIRFAHPEYFWLLLLGAIAAAAIIFHVVMKRRMTEKYFAGENRDAVFNAKSVKKDVLKQALLWAAFLFAILGFAGPQLGSRLEEVKQVGIDIVICLDVSRSMRAEDLKPDRLEYAKREVSSLMKQLQGDRIGLVVFAGDAFVQIPLTNDYSAAGLFLNAINEHTVPVQGTALAKAISTAGDSFDPQAKTKKAIIIISDGEDHEGNLQAAIDDAKSKQIVIYTIGIGSPLGSPIPIYTEDGNRAGFKNDESGKTVLTAVNETMLSDIANQAGGKYYLTNAGSQELEAIHGELSGLEKSEFGMKKITGYEDKFYYFLIPAFLLLAFELTEGDTKSRALSSLLKKMRLTKQ
jgi:Ca-activated chloride channel family protein